MSAADLQRFERELAADPALAERVSHRLPLAEIESDRVIRCSPESIDRAICRAIAKAAFLGELWHIEVTE